MPLRTLPLATGSKVVGLGHSFIGLGAAQTYTAGQTATGHTGFYENQRTVLSWIKAADGRFNLDMFAELNSPFFAPGSFAAFSGAMAGKSGDCLFPVPGLEAQFPGTLARTAYSLSRSRTSSMSISAITISSAVVAWRRSLPTSIRRCSASLMLGST